MVIQRDIITLKNLLCFSAVAVNGKISDTALKNGMKQSNLSKTIKALETELGLRLFNRVHDGVTLTENGRNYFELACELERIIQRVRTFAEVPENVSGVIRVWTSEGIGSSYIANYLSEFYLKYPDVHLDIRCSLDNPKINSEVDIGIVYQEPNLKDCNIVERSEMVFKLYASQTYLNNFGFPQDIDDLIENHRICSRYNFLDWPEWCQIVEKSKHHVANTNTSGMLLSMVKNGAGIALLPTCAGDHEPNLLQLKKINLEIRHPFWVITHNSTADNPTVLTLVNYLTDITRKL